MLWQLSLLSVNGEVHSVSRKLHFHVLNMSGVNFRFHVIVMSVVIRRSLVLRSLVSSYKEKLGY